MLHQCACCGGKVDTDNDSYEEVHDEKFSQFFHVLCWDTKQTIERKVSQIRAGASYR